MQDKRGLTPLHLAADKTCTELVKALLAAPGADVDAACEAGVTLLQKAAFLGNVDIMQAALLKGANVDLANKKGSTALMLAVSQGHVEIAKALLEAGASTDAVHSDGTTALANASIGGHTAIVRMLLEAGADAGATDGHGKTACHLAVENARIETVEALLGFPGVQAEEDEEADEAGDSAVPALRCWVNVPDATGTTLLMCAVKHGLTDIVQLLLADTIAADPNASDAECKTALHWATEASDVGSARALLAAGADKNAKDSGGNTALLVAARNASVSVELVTVLLQAGSNANAVNGEEDTALLLAVRQCRWSTAVVEALLTGGADAGAKGKDGRTAHKIARRAGNLALARMLLDYSAPTVDGDGEMCVICLVCVPSDDHATTPCGHHYHHTCLARWTLEQATCPMCKAALPDDSDGGEDEEELSYDMEARRWHIAETS